MVSKLDHRRQVVIPKEICDAVGLREGDFVEITKSKRAVVLKPRKTVNRDDILTAEEAIIVRRGEAQIRRGQYITLDELEHGLAILIRSEKTYR